MSGGHQEYVRGMQRALMDELDKFFDELTNDSNKHRVYLAWKRLQAIKISAEVKE